MGTLSPYNLTPPVMSTGVAPTHASAAKQALRDPQEKIRKREKMRQEIQERKRLEQEKRDQEKREKEEQKRYCFDRIRT